jgi:hypothetical protein
LLKVHQHIDVGIIQSGLWQLALSQSNFFSFCFDSCVCTNFIMVYQARLGTHQSDLSPLDRGGTAPSGTWGMCPDQLDTPYLLIKIPFLDFFSSTIRVFKAA